MRHLPCLLLVLAACSSPDDPDVADRPDAGAPETPDALPTEPTAITPSNADAVGNLAVTGLVVTAPDGTFDTDAECVTTSALGTCEVVTRPGLPEACVCRADELTIGSLRVTGTRALVLLAWRAITIEDVLDVSAAGSIDGPGASRAYATSVGGLLGGAGGSHATTGAGDGVALSYGTPELAPLLGGMRGQDASRPGGGGGGAVQLTAGERITVLGLIAAGGGGGASGARSASFAGGGGGGAGGAVLIEAPAVSITGTVVAHGGGGGGGGGSERAGGSGGDGAISAAPGGFGGDGDGCPLYGYVAGGDGGAGATGAATARAGEPSDYDNSCIGDASYVGAGGGGGAVGRIRVNTATGCACGGSLSPNATFGTVSKP